MNIDEHALSYDLRFHFHGDHWESTFMYSIPPVRCDFVRMFRIKISISQKHLAENVIKLHIGTDSAHV